jgi:hypothetical protein
MQGAQLVGGMDHAQIPVDDAESAGALKAGVTIMTTDTDLLFN